MIGMWKAFAELRELGWLKDDTLPRMVSVQSDGCAPIVRAFDAGERFAEPFAGARTIASDFRAPRAFRVPRTYDGGGALVTTRRP